MGTKMLTQPAPPKRKFLSLKEIRRATVYGSVLASFVIEDFGINRFNTLTMKEI